MAARTDQRALTPLSAWRKPSVCAAVGVVLLLTLARTVPNLMRPELYESDANQHIFWMYQYVDPALFPDDPITRFYMTDAVSPLGYRVLYRELSRGIDPLAAAKIVSGLFIIFCGFMAFRLGKLCGPENPGLAGIAAVVLLVLFQPKTQWLVPTGIQRAFALPILILGVWSLVSRRVVWFGVACLFGALFYPMPLPQLLLMAVLVSVGRLRIIPTIPRSQWVGLAILVILTGAVLAARHIPAEYGPIVRYAQGIGMPEFWHGGDIYFSHDPIVFWFTGDGSGISLKPVVLASWIVLFAGAMVYLGADVVSWEAWSLLIAAFTCFLLAHLLAFRLFVANRHLRTTFPLFAMMALCSMIARLSVKIQNGEWGARLATAIKKPAVSWKAAGVLVVITALYSAGLARARLNQPPPGKDVMDAYAYLRDQTPKDWLIAEHPVDAIATPLLAHRSVLMSTLHLYAYYTGYYSSMRPRIMDEWNALYATDWSQVDALYDRYHVRAFMVERHDFAPTNGIPGNGRPANLPSLAPGESYVLENPPPDRILFQEGDVWIVRVGPSAGVMTSP
jgi:hypothetical protein